MDECLYTSKGPQPIVLWRPGNGRSIVKNSDSYLPFTHIVRTVHVEDALDICRCHRMCPKPVISCSRIRGNNLPNNHPCRNLKVLWFGTKQCPEVDEDKHDWYGNVQFSLPANILLKRWKFCYLVEIMSAPTHTATRILITNKNYSKVLPEYNPYKDGGPWKIDSRGYLTLSDCLRYNNEGSNMHGHTLEFMLEVTEHGQKQILDECEISFRNHLKAANKSKKHVCHRFQNLPEPCPTPVTAGVASELFFEGHAFLYRRMPIAKPRLSNSGELCLQRYRKTHLVPETLPPPPLMGPLVPAFAPQPVIYINQQSQQFVMGFPKGLIAGQNRIITSCFNVGGPVTVQQLQEIYYVFWNNYLVCLLKELQRLRKETNHNEDHDKAGHLPNALSQGYPALSQLPVNHNQLDPLRQGAVQNLEDPFLHKSIPSHPLVMQPICGQVTPTKPQQIWGQGQPGILQHSCNPVHPTKPLETWGQGQQPGMMQHSSPNKATANLGSRTI